MHEMSRDSAPASRPSAGQVPTVLALGHGENAVAVVTEILVTPVSEKSGGDFIPAGPTSIEDHTLRHYQETIVPLLRAIASDLHMNFPQFRISVSNLNVSASQDRGMTIGGFSADAALFLACVSALLDMPTVPGIVATGHIASIDGGIRMVKNLPAKMRAVRRSETITAFLYPDPEADDSLSAIAPDEHTAIQEAILSARDHLKLVAIRNVDQLLQASFSETDLIVSSLNHGYFSSDGLMDLAAPGVQVLKGNLPERFWSSLETAFHRHDCVAVINLLEARVQFQLREPAYPQGFGRQLYHLVAALPPSTRDFHVRFPLLSSQDALSLVKLATASDLNDLRQFLDAVSGDHLPSRLADLGSASPSSLLDPPASNEVLETLLNEIDEEVLRRKIGNDIDAARGRFLLEKITVQTNQECMDTVTSFYLHMQRHSRDVLDTPDAERVAAEADELFEKTFAPRGGTKAAFAEARTGVHGGLRLILDLLVNQFKVDEFEKHTSLAFKRMSEALEYEERLALVKAFMKRLEPYLPEEVLSSPPERYVEHVEVLIRAYVQAMSQVKQLLRST